MNKRNLIFILCFLILSVLPADAATYWVAKTGSDSNSCTTAQTEGTPKLTIASGISCLQVAGDILQIKVGTYVESITSLPASGTSGSPITIRSKPGDAVTWRASDTALDSHNGALNIFDRSWITINGFTFDGSVTHSTIRFVNSGNIETVQRVGIVITNNTFSNNGNNGKSGTAAQRQSSTIRFDKIGHQLAYAGAATSVIANNTFTDNFGDNISLGNTTGDVWVHDNTSTGTKSSKNVFNGNYYQCSFLNSGSENRRLLVEDNTISDMDAAGDTYIDNGQYEGSGIRLDSGLENSIFRQNIIHDINYGVVTSGSNQGYGIHPEARVNNSLFQENIIYRIGEAGIRVGAESVSQAENNTFIGNVIFDCTMYGMVFEHAKAVTVRNNIVMNAGYGEIHTSDSTVAHGGHVFSNNLYFDSGGGSIGRWNAVGFFVGQTANLNLASWNSASGETNSVGTDPTFVDTSDPTYDFHLQAGSPAIDAGFNGVDIGAFPDDTPPVDVEYFVNATGGSNSNTCEQAKTVGTPKLTIGGASGGISCLNSGEILTIKAGTYAESDIGLSSPTIPSGSSDDSRTVVRAATGETVTIRPASGTSALHINSKDFISIEGIIFDCTNVGGHCVAVGRLSTANNPSSNITLDSIEVFGADIPAVGASGIIVGNRQDTVLTNCNMIVRDVQVHNNGGDSLGHGLYASCRGVLVDGGAFYSNAGTGVNVYCHGQELGGNAWTGCTDTIVRNVEARNNGTTGIGLYNGSNLQAYNNLVHNNGEQGIAARFGCNQCKIYNNTLYSNGTTGGINITSSVVGSNASSTGVVVKNNILFQNDGVELADDGISTVISNDLCEVAGTGCIVLETVAANIFTNLAANDFTLISTSPAIGNGFDLSSVFTTDYAGNTRSVPFDIGAYEFVGAAETISLLVPNNGELWVKGTQQTIQWSSSNLANVIIRLDRGNDGVYEEQIIDNTPSDGSFDWTPGGTATSTAKLQICDAADNDPCDTSNAVFSLVNAPGTTLTKIISENTVGSFPGDIPGVEETTLWSDQPTTNFANSNLNFNKSATVTNNSLLRFTGLSQIPANAVVDSVTVGVFLQAKTGSGAGNFDLRKMLRAWLEPQATWNVFSTGNNWTTAGGTGAATDRVAAPAAQIAGVVSILQFYSVTDGSGAPGGLLDLVRDWVDGGSVNNGFHIERNGAGADGNFWTWTSSEGTNGQRPYMSITYTVSVGTITVTQPFSDDKFFVGEMVPVRWQTSNVSGGLDIFLSRDGGVNYLETLATNFPLTGVDFAWTVTKGTCNSCMIKVQSVNDPSVVGISAPFRVRGGVFKFK